MRHVAKNLVAARLCHRCLVQISYAIGVPHPLSINVNTYGTGVVSEERLVEIVKANFDMRPGMIIQVLGLNRPIFEKTAVGGHFGRNDPDFTWEAIKKLTIPDDVAAKLIVEA